MNLKGIITFKKLNFILNQFLCNAIAVHIENTPSDESGHRVGPPRGVVGHASVTLVHFFFRFLIVFPKLVGNDKTSLKGIYLLHWVNT